MRCCSLAAMPLLLVVLAGPADLASAGDKKDAYLFVVPPVGGKEVKLADWRFSQGTRRLSFGTGATKNPQAKVGPEYLEFREEKSTTFHDGILTLIPLGSIRKLDYDPAKKTVAVVVAEAGGKDATLTGTTRFKGINKITLEADAILDGLGAAAVKFQGGSEKESLHSVRFPNPSAAEEVKGKAYTLVAADKEKTTHTAYDLQPLYAVDGAYRILPYVPFKKTVKIDMDKIASLRFVPSLDKKKISHDYEVTLRDGVKHTLTLLTKIDMDKKKAPTFVGFLGRVPAGYKVFPAHTILEMRVEGPSSSTSPF